MSSYESLKYVKITYMITSTHNPRIQAIRAVMGRSRQRQEAGVFVVEGVRLAEEALKSNWPIRQGFFTASLSNRGRQVVDGLVQAGAAVEEVSETVMQTISDTETAQGLLVEVELRSLPLPPILDFILVTDALHDPGNLGTLLRTAAGAGVQAVLLGPGTADVFAPKVVRAAMGAHFHLPLLPMDWKAIGSTLAQSQPSAQTLAVFLADSGGGLPLWQVDLRRPCALVVGSEATGPGPEARGLATGAIHIPMRGQSESLNVAVATAILLFEVVRQRHFSSGSPPTKHKPFRTP